MATGRRPYLQILARVGERDSTLAEIERILGGASWSTSDPRLQALLVKYGRS